MSRYVSRPRGRSTILASLLLAAFAINLDITIVNVALPSLVRELHASTSQLQWVVDAYSLVFAALILAAGSLSDRLGRKGFLLVGLGVFGTSSLAGGLTSSAGQLIVARCFMGLGAAMIFPSTLSLISNVFTERGERARAIGLWGASAGAAIALGPIAGGWLLEHFAWQSIFIAMAPVAAAGAALVAASVPTSRDPRAPRIDLPGLLLSTAAMAILIYTIIEAPAHGWSSVRSLAGFALAAGLLGAFIARERTAREPMIDLGLFRNHRFSAASGSVTVTFFSLAGFIFLITQYFQFLKGYGLRGRHQASRAVRHQVRRGRRPDPDDDVLRLGVDRDGHHHLPHDRDHDGDLRHRHGTHERAGHRGDHGGRADGQAGVGSAVNDATRLLGSTLGVAVLGSVYASVYASRIASRLPATLPPAVAHAAHRSVGAALAVAARLHASGHAAFGGAVHHTAAHAFTHGLSIACLVAACVTAVGAVLAAVLLPAHPPRPVLDARPVPATAQPIPALDL